MSNLKQDEIIQNNIDDKGKLSISERLKGKKALVRGLSIAKIEASSGRIVARPDLRLPC